MAGVLTLEAGLTAAGDIQHGYCIARQFAGFKGVDHTLKGDGRCFVDIDAFGFEEELLHRCDVVVGGAFHVAANADIKAMKQLFLETEGIDIHEAAAVALQGMIHAFEAGKLPREAFAMLNITGGGQARFQQEHDCWYLKPSLVGNASDPGIVEKIEKLFN